MHFFAKTKYLSFVQIQLHLLLYPLSHTPILGYYLPDNGGSSCEPCPAGHQCNATTATTCDAGTISETAQMACTTCSHGRFYNFWVIIYLNWTVYAFQ